MPNGKTLEERFDQYQLDLELEHRHSIAGLPGAVRVTVFRNRGRFSRFDDAVALARATGQRVDPALTRERRTRAGIHVNIEQAVTKAVGVFARAGVADGSVKPYDFTDIERTAQFGASIKGTAWGRAKDTVGVVEVINGIWRTHQRYLDAGGDGVLVGDSRQPHPGSEFITETYYSLTAFKGVKLSADYQFIANPGYNRDRGPAHVLALRLHGEF